MAKSDPSSALRARRSHKTQFRCIMKTQNDHAILLVDKRWLATWYGNISHDIPCVISYYLQLLLMFYPSLIYLKPARSLPSTVIKAPQRGPPRRVAAPEYQGASLVLVGAEPRWYKNSTDFQKAESHESWVLRFTFSSKPFLSHVSTENKKETSWHGVRFHFFLSGNFLGSCRRQMSGKLNLHDER